MFDTTDIHFLTSESIEAFQNTDCHQGGSFVFKLIDDFQWSGTPASLSPNKT